MRENIKNPDVLLVIKDPECLLLGEARSAVQYLKKGKSLGCDDFGT